ncbi:MAG: hypothetical protein M4579_001964 [Chaenotheca gracillima]|nr:MAG: hypothetical protein M4579_001964 [Chaenotheca gracillima]
MASDSKSPMRDIPATSLNHLPSRINYLQSFLDFTEEDGARIQSTAPVISPLLPVILEAVYTKLLSFTITAKAFVPRQPGFKGSLPASFDVHDLTVDSPMIAHRKNFLRSYLVKLVSNKDWSETSPFWEYLDKVGIMHTGEPGFERRKNKPELRVEYANMGVLLAFVEDAVISIVMGVEGLDEQSKTAITRSFNKLLWIQNDLFARHYVVDLDSGHIPRGAELIKLNSERDAVIHSLIAGIFGLIFGVFIARLLNL